jgi:hypothetical protein
MVVIFDPACELLPPWTKELYLCTFAPLPSLWPPPPPSQTKCTVYWVGILSPAMGRGIDSRNRVWNWVAKLHRLAGRYDNPMPAWFLAPIAGLKLPLTGTVYRLCDYGGGGGGGVGGRVELGCRPYSAGLLHSVSDQLQNLQNCFTTPNKNDQ